MKICRSSNSIGRECAILRAIGFSESTLGGEIQDFTYMKAGDVAEVLNGLIAAGYVERIPYCEQIELAETPVAFEVNAARAHNLKNGISRVETRSDVLGGRRFSRPILLTLLPKKLANYIFDRQFLYIDIGHVACA